MRILMLCVIAPAVIMAAALPGLQTQGASSSRFTASLADRADVKQAFGYLDSHFDAQVAEWIHLTEIPALSTHEQQRAAYLSGELKAIGLTPTTDEIGNVMVRRKGTGGGPTILFSAHMDTVHPMDRTCTSSAFPTARCTRQGSLTTRPPTSTCSRHFVPWTPPRFGPRATSLHSSPSRKSSA